MKRLIVKLGVHASPGSLLIAVLFFGLTVAASAQTFTVNNLTAAVSGVAANVMLDPNGNVISIDGLWALAFADGGIADFTTVMGPYNACYFTAGTQMGQHGLFGNLIPVDSEQTHDEE